MSAMKAGITLGQMGQPGVTATRLAERAIAITATLGIDTKALLALNRETGRVSLHDHSDDPGPATYFARGVTRTSDPDDLADDLIDEAIDCGLLTPRAARGVAHRRAVAVPVVNMSDLAAKRALESTNAQ